MREYKNVMVESRELSKVICDICGEEIIPNEFGTNYGTITFRYIVTDFHLDVCLNCIYNEREEYRYLHNKDKEDDAEWFFNNIAEDMESEWYGKNIYVFRKRN